MLVYPKIAHEVMSYQAIFILGCGCDLYNMVQPCWFIRKSPMKMELLGYFHGS